MIAERVLFTEKNTMVPKASEEISLYANPDEAKLFTPEIIYYIIEAKSEEFPIGMTMLNTAALDEVIQKLFANPDCPYKPSVEEIINQEEDAVEKALEYLMHQNQRTA